MSKRHAATLDLTPVKSSHVDAIGYDASKRILHVKFKGGATYTYPDVPEQKHVALVQAESKGKFLREQVYPHHEGVKVEGKKK